MRYSSDQASNAFKFLQLPYPIVQAFALLTFHDVPQLPLHCRDQSFEIRFHHVILRSHSHGIGGYIFANRSGNEDERHVGVHGSYRAADPARPRGPRSSTPCGDVH